MASSHYHQILGAKKKSYTNLKIKLSSLWQLNESFHLIDLGYDYYLIKFQHFENFNKILQNGHWFIGSQYLTIWQWEPKFNPALTHINYTTVWIRLQKLSTKYYDIQILQKIAKFIGTLIKNGHMHSSHIQRSIC